MIPQTGDDLRQDFEFETLPSRTFRLNHNTLTVIGTIDEIEAVEQAVYLILNTERYRALTLYNFLRSFPDSSSAIPRYA